MKTFSPTDLAEIIPEDALAQVNGWLARGDGVAVYKNEDFTSVDLGDRRFVSFGSKDALFEVPPDQLPDFPREINWRYRLEGVYRGKVLEAPSKHDWAKPVVVLGRILDSFGPKLPSDDRGRLVDYELSTKAFTHGPHLVTIVLHVMDANNAEPQVGGDALVGNVEIQVTAWTDERGEMDRLGPYSWTIEGPQGALTGSDVNLGSTLVSVHNLSLRPT